MLSKKEIQSVFKKEETRQKEIKNMSMQELATLKVNQAIDHLVYQVTELNENFTFAYMEWKKTTTFGERVREEIRAKAIEKINEFDKKPL